MTLNEMITQRRSVRKYPQKPVSKELLDQIMAFCQNAQPLYPDIKLVNSADTNADGKIDISDALITLRTLANEKGTASDVNRDGLVTAVDVMLLFVLANL